MVAQTFQLIYCSLSAMPDAQMVAEEIETIVAFSRRYNERNDITGGLLFANDCFAQVLEGAIDEVQNLYARIRNDARHRNVTLLQPTLEAERSFPNWSLGYAAEGRALSDAGAILRHALEVPDEVTATEVRTLIRKCIAGGSPA